MAELNDKFEFEQDGKTYSLCNLPDGFVIKGDVNLSRRDLTELPDLSKVTVEGDFNCEYNKLTSLQGAPQKVGGDFDCSLNQLTTLQGAPQKIGGCFSCRNNLLTTLEGAPQKVGDFNCRSNKLTSLKGAPQEVGKSFICFNNKLTTLKGAPQEVGGDFVCFGNQDLVSLFGLPKMPENNKIYCDDELAEKYDNPESYKDLIASAKYKSELSAHIIRQKKHEENKTVQAKFKAGYAAFKKMKAEERE